MNLWSELRISLDDACAWVTDNFMIDDVKKTPSNQEELSLYARTQSIWKDHSGPQAQGVEEESTVKVLNNSASNVKLESYSELNVSHSDPLSLRRYRFYSETKLVESNFPLHELANLSLISAETFSQNLRDIEDLLKLGFSPNEQNHEGQTAIHLLFQTPYKPIEFWGEDYGVIFAAHKENVLRLFLDYGGNINVRDREGNTALHCLASSKYIYSPDQYKLTQSLLKNGADSRIRNNLGELPIHIAYRNNESKILNLLIRKIEDLNLRDPNGRTFLHLEAQRRAWSSWRMEQLLKKCPINAKDGNGHTALHLAVFAKNTTIVPLLVEKGAVWDMSAWIEFYYPT